MNLEAIEKRMNEIVSEIKTCTDVEKIKELSTEYDGLNEQRNVFLNARSKTEVEVTEVRTKNPFMPSTSEGKEKEDIYASKEYRSAFKNLVQRGTPIPVEYRAGGDPGTTVTTDIGAIIPTTILNEFIKEVSKVYGQIYSKVRKMNIKGGVKIPISKLKAEFKWITETTTAPKQKAGDIKDFIEFSYNIGEIRIASTLLANIVSLDLFETEITKLLVEAYVEAMDKGIINGAGTGQLLGITKDTRVKNVVEMTEEEFSDWTAWRKKLFAKIPLSKRGQGEFIFTASTTEMYLMTMKDKNDRPLYTEATGADVGVMDGRFFGRSNTLVEPDVIADFDTASEGDVVGIFGVFTDYAINSNLQFGVKRYFDENTNEWIDKALVVVDGKVVDPSGFYLIKKKNSSLPASATSR